MLMSAAFLASALIQFALGLVVAWVLGAAEFGAYALALAAAVLVQTIVFEWIRLSATRFHHGEDGNRLAGLLMRYFSRITAGLLVVALLLLVFGEVRRWLLCVIPLVAVAAGFVDFRAALLRAEFNQRGYALLMLFRNLLAIILLPLAAWHFGSAEAVLAAFLLALVVSAAAIEIAFRRGGSLASPDAQPIADLRALLRYSGPIVATNCVYLALFFGLRSAVALTGGMAAAGQFSLAFDFVTKLFTTIGTAIDLALFQLAVRAARDEGEDAGKARVAVNAEIVAAILLPMAVGLFLVVSLLEEFLVAPAFRGPFSTFVMAVVPGIALYALIQYALHPFLQIVHRTKPLVHAAMAGFTVAGFLALAMPILGLALVPAIFWGLAGAMLAAMLVLIRHIGRAGLPSREFAGRLMLALAGMIGVVLVIRPLGQGLGVLTAAITGGAATFAIVALLVDLVGLRTWLRARKAA